MLIYTMLSGCVPLRSRRVSDCAATSPIALLEKRGSVIAASCSLCGRTSRRALIPRHSVTNLLLLHCRCAVAEWRMDSGIAGAPSLPSHVSSTPNAALLRNDVIATAFAAALSPNGCMCVTSSAALVAQAEREGRRSSLTPLGVESKLQFSCRAGAEYPMSGTAKGTKRAAAEASISNISSLA